MYYFVYQTKNLINQKTYIGVHKTNNVNDGYIGCGIYSTISGNKLRRQIKGNSALPKAIQKYGIKNFKREILSFFDNYDDALEEETFLVNSDWINSKENYNIALGGSRGCYGWKMPKEQKEHLSTKMKGRFVSEETRLKLSNSLKGIKRTEETKLKISKIKTKYNLDVVYEEIYPMISKGLSESEITNLTGYSKGTIYRAKKIKANG